MANTKGEGITVEELAAKVADMEEQNKTLRLELQEAKAEKAAAVNAEGPIKPAANLNQQPKKNIRLFADSGRYADDVFVGVNGQTFQIQRGVDVEVPEAVAEVLENAAKQNADAANYMRGLQNQYEADKEHLN